MAKNEYYFDEISDSFDIYMNDYDVERRKELIFSVLMSQEVLSQKQILEIGSGTGKFSEVLVSRGARLTIIDIGPRLVAKVKQRLKCEGVVGDACNLPFADSSFDYVISSECIEHTPDPLKAIREMCRCCRPGGKVCLTTPNKLWFPVLWLSQKLKLRRFSGIENWISPSQAEIVMNKCGLTDIQIRGCHICPFQLSFLRPLLRFFDQYSRWLYPLMINFGIIGCKTDRTISTEGNRT